MVHLHTLSTRKLYSVLCILLAVFFSTGVYAKTYTDSTNLLPPHITSFSPTSAGQYDTLLINGVNFADVRAVSIGGTFADTFMVSSSTLIRAVVPYGATRSDKVVVTTVSGLDSIGGFHYTPHVLSIYAFTPQQGKAGDTIIITGNYFTGITGVYIAGGSAAWYQVISPFTIKAVVGNVVAGDSSIIVYSSNYYADTIRGFKATLPAVKPTITGIYPPQAYHGNGVWVYGTHFTGTYAMRIGGAAADSFSVYSDTLIYVLVPAASLTGAVKVDVFTAAGEDSVYGLTVLAAQVKPVITAIYPVLAHRNDWVSVYGHYFTGTSSVKIGGAFADTFHVYGDTLIYARIPFTAATGSVQVAVTTAAGADSASGLTVIADTLKPEITGIYPAVVHHSDFIYIYGRNFTGAYAVRIGGAKPDTFATYTDTLIYVKVPQTAATGSVQVAVFTGYGADSASGLTILADSLVYDSASAKAAATMQLYPNPASGSTTVVHPVSGKGAGIMLFNMTGTLVKRVTVPAGEAKTTLPLNSVPPGMYKAMWSDGSSSRSVTIMVQ